MIVSWDWLKQYVELSMSHDELVDRLTMSGLNHEGTEVVAGDQAIDLEVTSNRPDCLGHIGVAREIAILFELPLKLPNPEPKTNAEDVNQHCQVEIQCPSLCRRYTARLIRGAKITSSPAWLSDRLTAAGIASINNVVDATNYVMLECGQPLHAFDFGKVKNGQIIVREPKDGETIEAIDHKTYALKPGMCIIADSDDAVAIGGVMGGADSEISASTTDILIEAAYFNQLSVRNTARSLSLHSPSSFRFERNVDSAQIDWASRRCCEIILETGGGELLDGIVDVGEQAEAPQKLTLRLSQLERILGIKIPADFVPKTLQGLGLTIDAQDDSSITCTPPTWRKDLTREIDLVEEVGRIYGFENVPDDTPVPMAASHKTNADRVVDKVRNILTASGFDEAMTPSLVPEPWSLAFSPWSPEEPLISSQPMLGVLEKASQNIGAVEFVRRSLIPSLLEARRINEYRSNPTIELFETAKVYLTDAKSGLPYQPTLAGLNTGGSFFELKGVIETLVDSIAANTVVDLQPYDHELLDPNESGELKINGKTFGFIGAVSRSGFEAIRIAEFDLCCGV